MFNFFREDGGVVIDGKQQNSTRQCKHCGAHEHIQVGSGKKRGWCQKCEGFLCGRQKCMSVCIPFEAKLEHSEAKNTNNQNILKKLMAKYPDLERIHL